MLAFHPRYPGLHGARRPAGAAGGGGGLSGLGEMGG